MSEAELCLLRWRGQTSGPHSWPAILKMLDEHEIGLWHEVQYQGRWLTLGDLLQERAGAAAASVPREKPRKIPRAPAGEAETVVAAPAGESAPAPAAAAPGPGPEGRPEPVSGGLRFRPRKLKVFVTLGVCLGFGGAHNFYAGYWGTGLAQLLFSALTFSLGFGFVITWLWAFIELLLVHTDGRGVRMT